MCLVAVGDGSDILTAYLRNSAVEPLALQVDASGSDDFGSIDGPEQNLLGEVHATLGFDCMEYSDTGVSAGGAALGCK